MDAQLKELLPFLHDRNPQVRQLALENLIGHTASSSPHRSIFLSGLESKAKSKGSGGGGSGGLHPTGSPDTDVARDLKLLCRDQLAIAHDAFRALVNLSDSPLWVPPLSEPSFLSFLVSYMLHPPSILADLAAMVLSNLTAHPSPCTALLTLKIPVILDPSLSYALYPVHSRSATSPTPPSVQGVSDTMDVDALPLLVDAFASSAKLKSDPASINPHTRTASDRKAQLNFLSSVFANVSATPPGRLFFVTPRPITLLRQTASHPMEFPIAKLIFFTEHPDPIRRGGVASTIKNCAFHVSAHRALLSPEDIEVVVPPSKILAPGVNALPAILLPLAGPEEFDLEDQEKLPIALQFLEPTKQREPDSVLRLTHIETLLLLCTTRWGRDFLRDHGTYEIIRATHENEHVDKISEHIERLVNMLKRDEAPGVDQEANVDDVSASSGFDQGQDHQDQRAHQHAKGGEDTDSDDERIEEV